MEETKRKPVEYYLSKNYSFRIKPTEEGGYVANIPDLPGCITQADTIDEVLRNIDDARKLWIEVAYENDIKIPLPREEQEYSGKFVIRLTKSLHRELAERAADEGTSLNQYVLSVLSTTMVRQESLLDKHIKEYHESMHEPIPLPKTIIEFKMKGQEAISERRERFVKDRKRRLAGRENIYSYSESGGGFSDN